MGLFIEFDSTIPRQNHFCVGRRTPNVRVLLQLEACRLIVAYVRPLIITGEHGIVRVSRMRVHAQA